MVNINNSIVDLGSLSEPAKVLIEKVSDAVGGIFKAPQIRRIAEAEAEAGKVKACARVEVIEIEQRAINRSILEETIKQKNIEDITGKSLAYLSEGAKPENMERDWLVDFFDKGRLISEKEMQELWARILAGEASVPGSFSKRTLREVASMSKEDADAMNSVCNFTWDFAGLSTPFIADTNDEIYTKNGINFGILTHLDSIGFISFKPSGGYAREKLSKIVQFRYAGDLISVELPKDEKNTISIGDAVFTNVGLELAGICGTSRIDGFLEYVLQKLNERGYKAHLVKDVTNQDKSNMSPKRMPME